jgi:hypothetical protein
VTRIIFDGEIGEIGGDGIANFIRQFRHAVAAAADVNKLRCCNGSISASQQFSKNIFTAIGGAK